MIVTIDGPAGTGKSTTARRLAEQLGFEYLDTGAMYRAVAAEMLSRGVDPADASTAGTLAASIDISFQGGRTFVNARDVTSDLRTAKVTEAASIIAQYPEVRAALIACQRKIAEGRNIVCEGRDQGTVAFPDAECKFFLTADPEIRARRRQQELAEQGRHVLLEQLLKEQAARDHRDATRAVAPLQPADDAILLNTSKFDFATVVSRLEQIVRERLALSGSAGSRVP